jgi:hypothetical protein
MARKSEPGRAFGHGERFVPLSDYVADHRAPAPLPGYDPDTGRKTWDAAAMLPVAGRQDAHDQ